MNIATNTANKWNRWYGIKFKAVKFQYYHVIRIRLLGTCFVIVFCISNLPDFFGGGERQIRAHKSENLALMKPTFLVMNSLNARLELPVFLFLYGNNCDRISAWLWKLDGKKIFCLFLFLNFNIWEYHQIYRTISRILFNWLMSVEKIKMN